MAFDSPPCDVLAEGGAIGQEIRSAGPRRRATKLGVEVHQGSGLGRQLLGAIPVLRVPQVHGPDVQRGRHRHSGTTVDECPDEVDRHRADVQAAIHVSAVHIDQRRRVHGFRDGHQDPHGQLGARTVLAVQVGPVCFAERRRCRHLLRPPSAGFHTNDTKASDIVLLWPVLSCFSKTGAVVTVERARGAAEPHR